jgi:hypothetical protein
MKELKRVQGKFEWVSPQEQRTMSRLSPMPLPPHPPEYRRPIYWLATTEVSQGEGAPYATELYFVNWSDETLNSVIAGSGGFQTVDDDVLSFSNDQGYVYRNVAPNEAVKVEVFDNYYDLDQMFVIAIEIRSRTQGSLRMTTGPEKGGVSEQVLLWDNSEPGKRVTVSNNQPAPDE